MPSWEEGQQALLTLFAIEQNQKSLGSACGTVFELKMPRRDEAPGEGASPRAVVALRLELRHQEAHLSGVDLESSHQVGVLSGLDLLPALFPVARRPCVEEVDVMSQPVLAQPEGCDLTLPTRQTFWRVPWVDDEVLPWSWPADLGAKVPSRTSRAEHPDQLDAHVGNFRHRQELTQELDRFINALLGARRNLVGVVLICCSFGRFPFCLLALGVRLFFGLWPFVLSHAETLL